MVKMITTPDTCSRKHILLSSKEAKKTAKIVTRQYQDRGVDKHYRHYRCNVCHYWHLTTHTPTSD